MGLHVYPVTGFPLRRFSNSTKMRKEIVVALLGAFLQRLHPNSDHHLRFIPDLRVGPKFLSHVLECALLSLLHLNSPLAQSYP